MDEERRWAWMAFVVGGTALAGAVACALAAVWPVAVLFGVIGVGLLLVGRMRLRRLR